MSSRETIGWPSGKARFGNGFCFSRNRFMVSVFTLFFNHHGLFATLRLTRHFARNHGFNVPQFPHDFIAESVLKIRPLMHEKTGE